MTVLIILWNSIYTTVALTVNTVLYLPRLFVRSVHGLLWKYSDDNVENQSENKRWLADDEDDGAIIREVFADSEASMLRTTLYGIKLITGDVVGAGTDADVYICLYGSKGNTGKIDIRAALHTRNKFERNRTDSFDLEREDLGTLERLVVGHNGKGPGSGWFLDSIEIEVASAGSRIIFPCEQWLSKDEDDGKIERELFPVEDTTKYASKVPYQIEIFTSDLSNAGTNADVFVQLYGADGKGEVVNLDNKSDNFERSAQDTFKIECRDVGAVHKLRIGHNGKGRQSGWHLEKIILYKSTQKRTPHKVRWDKSSVEKYYFTCNRWLARSEDDGEIVRELIATDEDGNPISDVQMVTYSVSTHTSDIAGAGTDSDVFITIHGTEGDSGERALRKSDNINKFEKGQVDVFSVSGVELGELTKVRIRQDDSGANAGWHCSHVEVAREGQPTRVFPCQRWLSTGEDDGQISRELVALPEGMTISDADSAALHLATKRTTYHVTVYTGDLFGAGTDSDVIIQLFGEKEDSGAISLKSCKSNSINKFERDAKDVFFVECVDVGNIERLKVWTDGSGAGSDWYLENIKIDIPSLGIKRKFPCEEWFGKDTGDGTLERELYPVLEADQSYKKSIRWEITVHTSDVKHAGTDAQIYVNLFGNKGRSGKVVLGEDQKDADSLFERGNVDVFLPEIPDIGTELVKLQVGHDGKGRGSGWHCDKIVARCLDAEDNAITFTFPCGRWLDKEEEDGQLHVDLLPETVTKKSADGTETEVETAKLTNETYTIKVHTGDKFGAGTDANCYISLYGTLGDSGERQLSKSENMDKFQRNQVDTFTIDCVELGEIYKVVLQEDDTNMGADWFVADVTVTDSTSSKEVVFPCEQWFSKSKGDKKTKRALYPKDMTMEEIEAAEKGTNSGIKLKEVEGKAVNDNLTEKEEEEEEIKEVKYLVTIETGPEDDMGTDADAYIILKSGEVETEELSLYCENGKFKPGIKEEFELLAPPMGDITSIVIGHNGVLSSESWFISNVAVLVPSSGARYSFQCERWLARDRGDRKLTVEFARSSMQETGASLIPHVLTVSTADVEKAGTECDVLVKVFGEKGASEEITLSSNDGIRFTRAMTVNIPVEIPDLGLITRLRVSVAGKNNWLFERMVLKNTGSGEEHIFPNAQWIEKGGSIDVVVESESVSSEKIDYVITVVTSDLFACGTDANVFCILYGETGDSGELALTESADHTNKFERNNTDTFTFSLLPLGLIHMIRIWHDDAGMSSSWHLDHVGVSGGSQSFNFPCGKWLSSKKEDKNLSRDLLCDNLPEKKEEEDDGKVTYKITVSVSNKKDAGTAHDIWLSLDGSNGTGEKWNIDNSSAKLFNRSSAHTFVMRSRDLGEIKHARVGLAPREGADPDKDPIKQCHLNQVQVETPGHVTLTFLCNHWLSLPGTPGRKSYRKLAVSSVKEEEPAPEATLTTYLVTVKTGDRFAAGTDANVFLTIYGATQDSGKRALVKQGENLFERKQLSIFELEMTDLGKISKIRIEHDNSGAGGAWFLDFITITNKTTADKYTFPCGEWLDKKKGNKQLFRVLWADGEQVTETSEQ